MQGLYKRRDIKKGRPCRHYHIHEVRKENQMITCRAEDRLENVMHNKFSGER
jgi:hypothetical protein